MSLEHTHRSQPQLPLRDPSRGKGLYDADLRDHHIELRRRFADAGQDALGDTDILELLLLNSTPRQDTRPLARELFAAFGSLEATLCADPNRLESIAGAVGCSTLKMVAAAGTRMARTRIVEKPLISSWDAVLTYCRTAMAHLGHEELRVLFLNRGNRLIADERMGCGTVDHVPVYPREILKRALELNACALILVHNHPSGDPTPSVSDIEMTKAIRDAGEALSIIVHDHLIIGADAEVSLASEGLF